MSDYTQTLNTLERMDLDAPVPVGILPPAIQDFLVASIGGDLSLGVPLDSEDMTVSEALDHLMWSWGTAPHVIQGLNGPDTYFDTSGPEHEILQAWLTDNGIDPATVAADLLYFDHSNNVLTYAEYDQVLAPQVRHMVQHTVQGAPIAALLSTY